MKFNCTAGKGIWIQQGQTTASGSQGKINGVAIDTADSSAIAIGYVKGTFDFTEDGSNPLVSPSGAYSILLAKFTVSGVHSWSKIFGRTWDCYGQAVVIDGASNIFITGTFGSGTDVDFGNGITLTNVPPVFGTLGDIFVAKFNASGICQWATSLGGNNGDTGFSIGLDGGGNVFIAGNCSSSNASFVSSTGAVSLTGTGTLFLAKLNGSGVTQWVARYGGANAVTCRSLAITSGGDLVVCGQTGASPDLGGGVQGTQGIFLAKYSGADGSYVWGHVIGSGDGKGVAIIPSSQAIVMTGRFEGALDFGGGVVIKDLGDPTQNAPGGIFLAQYTSAGVCSWAFSPNIISQGYNPTQDIGLGVSVMSDGTIVQVGQVTSSVSFDGNSLWYGQGGGIQNVFTTLYAGTHALVWADRSSDSNASVATSCSSNGKIYMGGCIFGTFSPPSTTLDGVSLWTMVYTICPFLIQYQGSAPAVAPNPADFIPIYAPSANTTFQSKFGFTWNGILPAGSSNILIKYSFPAGTITPGPGETTPFLLLNYPDPSGFFGPKAYGFVYKVTGGDGPIWGLGYTTILNWSWAAAFANSSGVAIGPYTAWQNVTKTAAVNVTNNGTVASTPWANLKVTTNQTNRGNLQSVSLS